MSGELKPCPFCGGSPQIQQGYDRLNSEGDLEWNGNTYVVCDCGASVLTGSHGDESLEKWNLRSRERELVEVLESLLSIIHSYGVNLTDDDRELVVSARSILKGGE